jgi:hypothetical protein
MLGGIVPTPSRTRGPVCAVHELCTCCRRGSRSIPMRRRIAAAALPSRFISAPRPLSPQRLPPQQQTQSAQSVQKSCGILAQRSSNGFWLAVCPKHGRRQAVSSPAREVSSGADDLTAIEVVHQLLQLHLWRGHAGRDGSPFGPRPARRALLRGAHNKAEPWPCHRRAARFSMMAARIPRLHRRPGRVVGQFDPVRPSALHRPSPAM